MEKYKLTVLGAGTWGIALSSLLVDNGHEVTLYGHRKSTCDNVRNGINKLGIKLKETVKITNDLEEACRNEIIIIAIPSIYIKDTLIKIKPLVRENTIIVNASKGIEAEEGKIFSEVIKEILDMCENCVLSGPVHAEELSRKLPAACVLACENDFIAKKLQNILTNDYFRIYTNRDVLGVELSGAAKNVIAIAAGIIEGLKDGDNAKAALITRGINEISELGIKMGGKRETFYGLAGLGDMIVTCTSMHSRNCRAGILIGEGKSLNEVLEKIGMVVEGVNATKTICKLALKYDVEMPITKEVEKVLWQGKDPKECIKDLMRRNKISE